MNLEAQKLLVVARIRPHEAINFIVSEEGPTTSTNSKSRKQSKIETVQSKVTQSVRSKPKPTSIVGSKKSITSSQSKLPAPPVNTKTQKDIKINLYACPINEENDFSRIALLNEPAISYSLLKQHFKSDESIFHQKDGLLPNSQLFGFDACFSIETTQREIYNALLQKRIKQVLNGFQLTLLIVGSQESGRAYTLRGTDQDVGMLSRACEDLLSLMAISKESIRSRKVINGGVFYNLGVQMYCVKEEAEVDLLVNAPEQLLQKGADLEIEMGCFDIECVNDLLTFYRQAKNRFQMIHDTLKGDSFKQKASFFIRLLILKNKQVYSSVNFIELFEYDNFSASLLLPVRDYLREVEHMQQRQLKSFSFQNKLLLHLNRCFTSGPEYQAILLGQFDSTPFQIENTKSLMEILTGLRDAPLSSDRMDEEHQKNSSSQKYEISHQYDLEQRGDEVAGFVSQSRKVSLQEGHEMNQTAGFRNQTDPIKVSDHQNPQRNTNESNYNDLQQQIHSKQEERQDNSEDLVEFQENEQEGTSEKQQSKLENNCIVNPLTTFGPGKGNQESNINSQMKSVQSAISDVFNFTEATSKMDSDQKLEWIKQQEQALDELAGDLGIFKPPPKGSQDEVQVKKIMHAKAFLSDAKFSFLSEIKGSTDQQDYQTGSQSQEDMDQKYYQPKNSKRYLSVEDQNEIHTEKSIAEKKRQILDQIDRTIQQESPSLKASRVNSTLNNPDFSQNIGVNEYNNEKTSSLRQMVTDTSEGEDPVNLQKNLKTLKKQIIEKDRLQDESQWKIKNRNTLMNEELDAMQERVASLQDAVKGRDKIISNLQYQLQEASLSQSRSFSLAANASRQTREALLERAQEDMHNNTMNLQNKLSTKKTQVKSLKQQLQQMDDDFDQERRRNQDDRNGLDNAYQEMRQAFEAERIKNNELQRLLDKTRSELDNRDSVASKLQTSSSQQGRLVSDLQNRMIQENELNKELRIQNQLQERKIIELERQLALQDEKMRKQKKKLDEERIQNDSERLRDADRRKQKTSALKQEVKELEKKNQNLISQSFEARANSDRESSSAQQLNGEIQLKDQEIEQLKEQISTLREDLDVAKHSNRDRDVHIKRERQEQTKLEGEIKRLERTLEEKEDDITNSQAQLRREIEQSALLEEQIRKQADAFKQQEDLLSKVERQNQFLTNLQNRDVEKLEQKINASNTELNAQRRDIEALKLENSTLRNELQATDREVDSAVVKANKYKKQVGILKQSLAEADEKLRELIQQKHNEIRRNDQQDDDDDVSTTKSITCSIKYFLQKDNYY